MTHGFCNIHHRSWISGGCLICKNSRKEIKEMRMSDKDHEVIYLQPECCADPSVGRLWCQDPDPEDCEDGKVWTKYVRADRIAELEALLKVAACPQNCRDQHVSDGRGDFYRCQFCAEREALLGAVK